MKDYFIYLCGGMGKFGKDNFDEGNKWRKYCKQALETCECDFRVRAVNPNDYFNFVDEPPQYNHKLRNSNLVIANFNDMYSLGSMSEIAIAYDRGIPVIALNEDGEEIHPWLRCMPERIFDDIDKMLDYIEDFYLK